MGRSTGSQCRSKCLTQWTLQLLQVNLSTVRCSFSPEAGPEYSLAISQEHKTSVKPSFTHSFILLIKTSNVDQLACFCEVKENLRIWRNLTQNLLEFYIIRWLRLHVCHINILNRELWIEIVSQLLWNNWNMQWGTQLQPPGLEKLTSRCRYQQVSGSEADVSHRWADGKWTLNISPLVMLTLLSLLLRSLDQATFYCTQLTRKVPARSQVSQAISQILLTNSEITLPYI